MNDPIESNLSQTENGGNRESSNSLGVIKRDNILLILEIIVLVVMVFSLIAAVLLVPENKIHIFLENSFLFYFSMPACNWDLLF